MPNQGCVQPTILTEVGEDNPARYWEFFGPVSMLFRAKDEADAVRIANDLPFGLGGSVFTADAAHGAEVARRISTGMVFVNHPTKVEADPAVRGRASLRLRPPRFSSAWGSRSSSITS
ncbi:aldehyde dehydrogenase family protein [Caulobacter segnis]